METPTVTSSSQTAYPWKAALRTGIAVLPAALIALIALLNTVSESYSDFLPTEAKLWIAGAIAFLTATSILVNRIMNIPGVDRFLTKLGLGATPKDVQSIQVPVEAEVTVSAPATPTLPYKTIIRYQGE